MRTAYTGKKHGILLRLIHFQYLFRFHHAYHITSWWHELNRHIRKPSHFCPVVTIKEDFHSIIYTWHSRYSFFIICTLHIQHSYKHTSKYVNTSVLQVGNAEKVTSVWPFTNSFSLTKAIKWENEYKCLSRVTFQGVMSPFKISIYMVIKYLNHIIKMQGAKVLWIESFSFGDILVSWDVVNGIWHSVEIKNANYINYHWRKW